MRMNKLFISLLLMLINSNGAGKTVLGNGQIPFSSVSPEMVAGFRLERTYAARTTTGGTIQGVLFGGASTNATESKLARYFFPHNKTCLSVAEDSSLDNFDKKKDLLAQDFSIFTNNGNFRSEISLAPQWSTVGYGVHWRQSVIRDPFKGDGLWLSVSTALERVKTSMNLKERVINAGGGPDQSAGVPVVANMREAFEQKAWSFGKISSGSLTKTALADIEIKIGFDNYLSDESSHMELYLGLVVPTGNKYNAEFIFEPIVGRGKYVGFMGGGAVGKNVWLDYREDKRVVWELAVHGEYLCKNHQKRSLDLVDRPWTRYIPLYANKEQAQEAADLDFIDHSRAINLATPGINLLTQQVMVSPGFSSDMNSAFVFSSDALRVELGYNLFFRRAERVKLACQFNPVFAIKHADGIGTTNPIRDITGNKYLEQQVFDSSDNLLIPVSLMDFTQSIIQEQDIDLSSASTPALFSHTVYGALGACFDKREHPIMIDGGCSYSFADNDAVITRWLLWIKSGISF